MWSSQSTSSSSCTVNQQRNKCAIHPLENLHARTCRWAALQLPVDRPRAHVDTKTSRESLEISRVGGAAERTTHTRTYTRFIGTTYTTIPIYVSTTNRVSPARREHNDRAHAARARRVHTLRPQAAPALACRKRQMHKHACAPRIFCNNNMASLCTRTCAMLLPPPSPRAASDSLMYGQSVALGGSRRQPISASGVCVCVHACAATVRA